ncbi:MAG: nitronate monooxygenase [Gammaproteobacteria bacterium]|jgi:NAD(P)H-dependent flavin oxidoreductase YrpB (nitropropane dioxygenase family)|nr:nitronate monooxygenase [Gammaproteobacteria bacterium]
MKSALCERLGIEFPLFAFSHCRDVVAAVSRAGGMGVFGAVTLPPDRLEEELSWIDDHVEGKPYGVDLIVPNQIEGKGQVFDEEQLLAAVPDAHKQFTAGLLASRDIPADDLDDERREHVRFAKNLQEGGAGELLEVAFSHPIKLIANALGVPPQVMLDMGKEHDVAVAALVGAKEHAIRQVNAGVDILVVAGGEAGGHCGDVSTLVLVPEVCDAVRPVSDVPILAAGGIVTGRQMAACMAMGADGAWTGSVWLTTAEAETNPVVKEKMLQASSRDTVRSRSRTGKPSRQLRSPWTDAWESGESPPPLPMPLQSLVSEPALRKLDKLAQGGHAGAGELATYWVGQGVGLMNQEQSVRAVVQEFQEDFLAAYERLGEFLGD